MYVAKLEMLGENYEGKGKTSVEAINSIPITFLDVKGKGTITLIKKQGKKETKSQRFLYARPLRRLISNKVLKIGLANNLEKLLAEKDTNPTEPYKAIKN